MKFFNFDDFAMTFVVALIIFAWFAFFSMILFR